MNDTFASYRISPTEMAKKWCKSHNATFWDFVGDGYKCFHYCLFNGDEYCISMDEVREWYYKTLWHMHK